MSFFRKLLNKRSDEWVYIGSNDYTTDYYDPPSVKISRELSSIQVTCQRIYTSKGKKLLCDSWETIILSNDEKDHIDHSYNSYIFDYNDRKISSLTTAYLSRSGELLGGWYYHNDELAGTVDEKLLKKYFYHPGGFRDNIEPGTVYEVIFNKLIKDYNIQR